MITIFRLTLCLYCIFLSLSCAQAKEVTSTIVETTTQGVLETVKNGKWTHLKRIMADGQLPKRYQLFESGKQIGSVNASTPVPEKVIFGEGIIYRMRFTEKVDPGQIAIGNLQWDPMPRKVARLSNTSRLYREVVRKLLDKKNLKRSKVNITQIFKVDLEGDGIEEVFISADYIQKKSEVGIRIPHIVDANNRYKHASDGDYSFILLRRMVNGQLVTDLLADEFHQPRSDIEKETIPATSPVSYSIVSIMDLNGDGRMEVVIRWDYYQWQQYYILELINNRFVGHPTVSVSIAPN